MKDVLPQCKTSSDIAGVIQYGEEVGVKGVGVRRGEGAGVKRVMKGVGR